MISDFYQSRSLAEEELSSILMISDSSSEVRFCWAILRIIRQKRPFCQSSEEDMAERGLDDGFVKRKSAFIAIFSKIGQNRHWLKMVFGYRSFPLLGSKGLTNHA